ncbi:MAG: hypothetical protein WCK18_05060 [Prolixibacteraceae bacterium]
MKFKFLLLLAVPVFLMSAKIDKSSSGFAIVIDSKSYKESGKEVDAYKDAIEQEGLKCFLIVDKWGVPDSIKNCLKNLYHSKVNPIEGAVFIGDIPVPMLRDAPHLSSAFKMDQDRYAWDRSSIPSDRFYDDFDLQFTFLKKDAKFPLLYYYSLNADSPQKLTVEIYTARIKPPEGKDKYQKLSQYLKKVVAFKLNPSPVDQVLYFTGHGYNSEDMLTWMDEKVALYQQFDYLSGQKSFIQYINFQQEEHIKFRLLAELKRKDLDLALLHHHGAPTTQLLDGTPETSSIQGSIDNIKYYLRSKLGSAKTPEAIEKTKKSYMQSLGVPEAWFDGTFDKKQQEADSIYNARLDINVEDLVDYKPNARMIQFDACFNGSYHLDSYMAATYLFNEGQTIVTQANSVNSIQDRWPDEMAGLLGLGLRAGFWNIVNPTLETHLIGDPTFAFKSKDPTLQLNDWRVQKKGDHAFWVKQLSSPYADVQALALHMLYLGEGKKVSNLLLDQYKSSKNFTVRMEAFKLLSWCKDDNFIQAINLGVSDSYELIQRYAANYIGRSGHESHIPYLINALLSNNTGKRVKYQLKNALAVYDPAVLLKEVARQIPGKEFLLDSGAEKAELEKSIASDCGRMKRYADEVTDKKSTAKERLFSIKTFRNDNAHPYVGSLMAVLDTTKNEPLKLAGLEMLGWFDYSVKRPEIEKFCNKVIQSGNLSPACRNEAIKTLNRIK